MIKAENISSPQNNHIKLLKKLALKKYRLASRQFTVENLTIISDALAAGYDCEALFVTPEFVTRHPEQFQSLAKMSAAPYYVIDETVNRHYSQLETPSGITALYNFRESRPLGQGPVIYLNGINDPGNLGTILRTAAAFGFADIVLDPECADIYNAKTIGAAKNSLFVLNLTLDRDGSWLANNQRPLYVTSSHGADTLGSFKPAPDFCLVLGNESHGAAGNLLAQADKQLRIDISDRIESLNVAIAAGILLYELKNN